MREYKNISSSIEPNEIEFTPNAVYIAKNITPYEENLGDRIIRGYKYDCTEYSKDEYMIYQDEKIKSLEDELKAAKILLGVD